MIRQKSYDLYPPYLRLHSHLVTGEYTKVCKVSMYVCILFQTLKLVSGFARISVPKSKHSCEIPSIPLLFFFAIDFMIFVTFLSLTSFTENDRFLLAILSFSFSKGFLIRFRCSKKKLQPKLKSLEKVFHFYYFLSEK